MKNELNSLLDKFCEKFAELDMEQQMDFIHQNAFLDTVYSKGWDDSNEFYRGNAEEC